MIEIENLTKTFGTQTVISDVSGIFYIPEKYMALWEEMVLEKQC